MKRDVSSRLRPLLTLARVSGLPTVWSNCLAGWWLGGGGNLWRLPWLFAGMTAIYFGGTFLNDAFDVEFDRLSNSKRPLAKGLIARREVLRWAMGWLALGGLCLFAIGSIAGILGLVLIACVVVYNAMHRAVTVSPALLGVCRFLVYPIAATAGASGITGHALWFGLAMGIYTTGCGFLSKRKDPRAEILPWPIALLLFPIFFALLMNAGAYRQPAVIVGLWLMIWLAICLWPILKIANANRRRAAAGLFAGGVVVDWLAVAPTCPRQLVIGFLLLFAVTLVAQFLKDR